MNHRYVLRTRYVLCAALGVALLAGPAVGQTTAHKTGTWTAPRTPFGQPDLQGLWTNITITPLERPSELGAKQFFTPREAVEFEKKTFEINNKDRRDGPAEADVTRAYNEFWWDRGTKVVPSLRTSLIVDPADGKIPALTPQAQKDADLRADHLRRIPEGPEDRNNLERCLVGTNAGPPMLPVVYNNNFQIVQNPGYVTILSEMIHDVRIIPLDGRPHLPDNIRLWMGDSRGHWEGNTLVVDTTNFTNKTHFRGAGENMHLVERFTRVKPDTILYEFRIEDPTAFAQPWAGEVPMHTTNGPIYEYACHEGNYGMTGLLSGARAEEAATKTLK